MAQKMATLAPAQKVTAGGIAGAAVTVIVFVLNSYVLPSDKPITAEIAVALSTVFTFLVSYLTPPSKNDQVVSA